MKTRLAPLALTVTLLLASHLRLRADEGQWPPDQLASFDAKTWDALRSRGLAFSAEELWDGKGGGLLTAAAQIGGCTASFISPEGLLVTNHHCGFDAIQLVSTPEKNYLENGFVARTRAEEVQAHGGPSRVLVLKRIADVTDRVRGPKSAFASAKTDLERFEAVERARKEIVAECEKTPGSRCQVAAFYDGLTYRLQEQTELKDVRLVYAPPRAVGEYGGEVDNFRWPRHTGDFSFFRVYVAPDGKPAPYAAGNVPYKPARWLRVSDKGVAPGDLVMIMGYPGRTQRFLTPSAVKNFEEWFYPLRSRTYTDLIHILEEASKGDAATALRVASQVKSLANVETNARGQIEGLRRNGVAKRVGDEAARLGEFLASGSAAGRWGSVLPELEKVLSEDRDGQDRRFFLEEIERSPGYLFAALSAVRWAEERSKPDLARDAGYQDRDKDRARLREKDATRSLAPAAQRRVLAYLVAHAMKAAGEKRIPALDETFGAASTAEAIEKRLAEMDGDTKLADESVRLANLDASLESLRASSEPYVRLALALSPELARIRTKRKETAGALLRLRPEYLSALRAYRGSQGKAIYPDANSTLRISFAEVKGYSPREATQMLPKTSVKGLLEKETGSEPFASPARVLDAARRQDYGRFADKDTGAAPIAFLANADTTGGNSGSPTVNGKGELVGLNFDRVWENVAGDFGWSPDYSRNVNVDIRYALWLMDRVDGAESLVNEMLGH